MLIKKFFDKRLNRIERLDDFRRIKSLTTEWHIWTFEIEISPMAIIALKEMKRKIHFNLEHDFWNDNWKKEMYWIRIDNECKDKKTDFNYNVTWYVNNWQHSSFNNRWVQIVLNHIDVSTKRWLLIDVVNFIAQEIDRRYWNDCWWKEKKFELLDSICNKKND